MREWTDRRVTLVKAIESSAPLLQGQWDGLCRRRSDVGERWMPVASLFELEVKLLASAPISERSRLQGQYGCPYRSAAALIIEMQWFLSTTFEELAATQAAVEYVHRRTCELAPWMQSRELTTFNDRLAWAVEFVPAVQENDLMQLAEQVQTSCIVF